jgi:hypothetical protein
LGTRAVETHIHTQRERREKIKKKEEKWEANEEHPADDVAQSDGRCVGWLQSVAEELRSGMADVGCGEIAVGSEQGSVADVDRGEPDVSSHWAAVCGGR